MNFSQYNSNMGYNPYIIQTQGFVRVYSKPWLNYLSFNLESNLKGEFYNHLVPYGILPTLISIIFGLRWNPSKTPSLGKIIIIANQRSMPNLIEFIIKVSFHTLACLITFLLFFSSSSSSSRFSSSPKMRPILVF